MSQGFIRTHWLLNPRFPLYFEETVTGLDAVSEKRLKSDETSERISETGRKRNQIPLGDRKFRKEKASRLNLDLPVEYRRVDLPADHVHAVTVEAGLLLYLPELLRMGNHLRLKLFFTTGSELNAIEALVE